MTQQELSEKAEISTNYLSHIENGLSKFSFPILIQIINALNTTPNRILHYDIKNEKISIIDNILLILEEYDIKKLEYIESYLLNLSKYDLKPKKK